MSDERVTTNGTVEVQRRIAAGKTLNRCHCGVWAEWMICAHPSVNIEGQKVLSNRNTRPWACCTEHIAEAITRLENTVPPATNYQTITIRSEQ